MGQQDPSRCNRSRSRAFKYCLFFSIKKFHNNMLVIKLTLKMTVGVTNRERPTGSRRRTLGPAAPAARSAAPQHAQPSRTLGGPTRAARSARPHARPRSHHTLGPAARSAPPGPPHARPHARRRPAAAGVHPWTVSAW